MNLAIAITLVTSLVIGIVAGFVMYRSSFCMAGMFRDLFLFRNTFMLRILVLFVAVAMLLLELVRQAGLIGIFPYPGFGAPALTTIAGGLIFGVGMSLAGGCVAGTLYKMGSGNIVSIAAFFGLIVGSTVYAEIHPFWSSFAAKTRFNTDMETIAKLVGFSQGLVVSGTLILLAVMIFFWQRTGKLVRKSCASGYLQPWKASVILAVLVTVSVVIIGIPLGITTSYAKAGSWLQLIITPEYVRTHEYFRAVSFDYTNHFLGMNYTGGPGPHADSISLIQFPLIAGIIAGGFLASSMVGEFRIYSAVQRRQLISGLAGGVLMGLAARMAPSCNVWHLLGGLPILATQSLFFLAGLVPGACLGGQLLTGLFLKETH
jgi:uncharacterized membrane protein YedE/YeeE